MSFQIAVQADRTNGCIPTSAISVLKHLGACSLPSESELIAAMAGVSGANTGFKMLRGALVGTCSVNVEEKLNGSPLIERLRQLTSQGELVLVALAGHRAHCVVVDEVDTAAVWFHDPWDGTRKSEPVAQFGARAAGDIATLHPGGAKTVMSGSAGIK